MKALILFLLLQNPLVQFNHKVMENGITKKVWYIADTGSGVFVIGQTTKIDDYVDLKIRIVHRTIISPVFIETNNGKFSMPIYDANKSGYSIIRLYFRLKEQWVSIDSGITKITVKTDRELLYIYLNDNLKQLKEYANSK
jgi:hypothetical protein